MCLDLERNRKRELEGEWIRKREKNWKEEGKLRTEKVFKDNCQQLVTNCFITNPR